MWYCSRISMWYVAPDNFWKDRWVLITLDVTTML